MTAISTRRTSRVGLTPTRHLGGSSCLFTRSRITCSMPQGLSASRFNNLGKTHQAEIEEYLVEAAGRLTWWAACRQVVAELKRRFRDSFVPDPPCGTIADEAKALDHICDSAWFRQALARGCPDAAQADVRQLLAIGASRGSHSALRRDLAHRVRGQGDLPTTSGAGSATGLILPCADTDHPRSSSTSISRKASLPGSLPTTECLMISSISWPH